MESFCSNKFLYDHIIYDHLFHEKLGRKFFVPIDPDPSGGLLHLALDLGTQSSSSRSMLVIFLLGHRLCTVLFCRLNKIQKDLQERAKT